MVALRYLENKSWKEEKGFETKLCCDSAWCCSTEDKVRGLGWPGGADPLDSSMATGNSLPLHRTEF